MNFKPGRLAQFGAFVALSVILTWLAQPAIAQTELQKANPEQIEQRFPLGLSNLEAGRPKVANPHFLAILSADPSPVRVRLELARAYFEARQ